MLVPIAIPFSTAALSQMHPGHTALVSFQDKLVKSMGWAHSTPSKMTRSVMGIAEVFPNQSDNAAFAMPVLSGLTYSISPNVCRSDIVPYLCANDYFLEFRYT